jgi:hypothetical protein
VLGCRRIFGTKVAYWSAISQPANSAVAQARTLMAIFIAGMGEAALVGRLEGDFSCPMPLFL